MNPIIETHSPESWEKLYEKTITDPINQVDFNGLDFTKFKGYKILVSSEVVDINFLELDFNDDTNPTSYDILTEDASGTSINVFTTGTNRWPIGDGKHMFELTILNNQPYLFASGVFDNGGTLRAKRAYLRWNTPATITKLSLVYSGDTPGLFAGNQFTLYGLR